MYDGPESVVVERALETLKRDFRKDPPMLVRTEMQLSPIDRPDIMAFWPEHVLIIECKVVIGSAAVRQARRYLSIAKAVWPRSNVVCVLYAARKRGNLKEPKDVVFFLDGRL